MMPAAKALGGFDVSFIGAATDVVTSGQMSIDVTGIDFRAGDIGVLTWTQNSTDASPGVSPSMSELYNNGTSFLYVMEMAGNETAIATTTNSGSAYPAVFAVFRKAIEPASASDTSGSGTAADPAAVAAEDRDIVVAISLRASASADSIPSGYTLAATDAAVSHRTTVAYKEITTDGSENPGVFGSTTGGWVAFTVLMQSTVNV